MNLTFVGHRCCDHSPNSGYDQLCALFAQAGWLDGRSLDVGRVEWEREPQQPAGDRLPLFHVIYGDCSGKSLPEILRKLYPAAGIISSVHQPVAQLKADVTALAAIKASDAIVAVSGVQASQLEKLRTGVPVYAIPHGVWIDKFCPPPDLATQPRKNVLFVGSFLRDWPGAKRMLQLLSAEGVPTIALGDGARKFLSGDGLKVELPPRVPEAELATMYERAAAVCLPLLDATASNALLEAMAAGCPIICPRLPCLIEDYLGSDSDVYEPGRYEMAVARILHYVRNPSARETKREALMKRSKQFDWSVLKQHYEHAYAELEAAIARKQRGRRAG